MEEMQGVPDAEIDQMERLEEVSAARRLRWVQRVLKRELTTCQEDEPTGRCGVIGTLSISASAKRT